jgi:hypothetical protein
MNKRIKLFSYNLKYDYGFAPNPFYEYCTLACCKPKIRKKIGRIFEKEKNEYDFWVVGISSADRGKDRNKLIYAMKVDEVLTFSEYFKDKRFKNKIPKWNSSKSIEKNGDNIYKFEGTGNLKNVNSYKQLLSRHNNPKINLEPKKDALFHKQRDLEQGDFYVLVAKEYYYFGRSPLKLNSSLQGLYEAKSGKHIREKHKFDEKTIEKFKEFIPKIKSEGKGLIDYPTIFKNAVNDSNKKKDTSCA